MVMKIYILIPSELVDGRVGGWGATGVGASSAASPPLIVDVEEERVKVCVKGARWVSFNSISRVYQQLFVYRGY